MSKEGGIPKTYKAFTGRFPALARAWESIREEESGGPFDDKQMRLIKLGIAVGGMREGSVHSAVRKALAAGISREEVEQVVALSASTIGLPSAVAIFSWVLDELDK